MRPQCSDCLRTLSEVTLWTYTLALTSTDKIRSAPNIAKWPFSRENVLRSYLRYEFWTMEKKSTRTPVGPCTSLTPPALPPQKWRDGLPGPTRPYLSTWFHSRRTRRWRETCSWPCTWCRTGCLQRSRQARPRWSAGRCSTWSPPRTAPSRCSCSVRWSRPACPLRRSTPSCADPSATTGQRTSLEGRGRKLSELGRDVRNTGLSTKCWSGQWHAVDKNRTRTLSLK